MIDTMQYDGDPHRWTAEEAHALEQRCASDFPPITAATSSKRVPVGHAERRGLTERLDDTENPVPSEEFIVHRYDSWGEFTADVDTWELV